MNTLALAVKAYSLAYRYHLGQKDKAGAPYIAHVCRVAERMTTDDERAVAYLHDVLEDTILTEDDLRAEFPPHIVDAVVALTHQGFESYNGYIARVKLNSLARAVKISDLIDNSNLSRLPVVTMKDINRQEKYNRALKFLMKEDKNAD